MALQLGALRNALIDAGAKPEMADKAAEEIAGYEREFADIRSDLKLLKSMNALTIGLGAAILLKLFVT